MLKSNPEDGYFGLRQVWLTFNTCEVIHVALIDGLVSGYGKTLFLLLCPGAREADVGQAAPVVGFVAQEGGREVVEPYQHSLYPGEEEDRVLPPAAVTGHHKEVVKGAPIPFSSSPHGWNNNKVIIGNNIRHFP